MLRKKSFLEGFVVMLEETWNETNRGQLVVDMSTTVLTKIPQSYTPTSERQAHAARRILFRLGREHCVGESLNRTAVTRV